MAVVVAEGDGDVYAVTTGTLWRDEARGVMYLDAGDPEHSE